MSREKLIASIKAEVEEKLPVFQEQALDIHAHPETSNEEYYSSKVLADRLEEEGFTVERDVVGHPTGFIASYQSQKPGPTLVYLAEFDALAGLGHGCGHNLYGNYSSLAAVALRSVLDEVGGELRVYGTPGEEGGWNGSAKESFVKEGCFKDVDAALCAHPGATHRYGGPLLAVDPIDIEFVGTSAHAAAAPEKGNSALIPLIQTFVAIDALRYHLPKDVNIHGVILDGGEAANVIPDYARARYYLRAKNRRTLDKVRKRVENIVKGQALATGTEYKFALFQNKVDDMILTPSFEDVYFSHFPEVGLSEKDIDRRPDQIGGSSDVGNVSQVVPTIQPYVSISDQDIAGHTPEFVVAAKSEKGLDSIRVAATCLALTGLDLITQPKLLQKIKYEHQKQKEAKAE